MFRPLLERENAKSVSFMMWGLNPILYSTEGRTGVLYSLAKFSSENLD